MTPDTLSPPPEGWAIVPADDPRLDCLPCIPLMRLANGKWEASIYQKGRCVSQDSRANYTYALPIQAEAVPGQAASAKPLAKLLIGDSWVTIFTPEKARGCDIKEVIWLRDYTSEEYAIVDSSCRRGTPMRMECTDQQNQDVPDQPPASADPKGQAGAAKPPLGLIPPEAMRQAAIVHGLGAKKYGAWNWRETKVLASTYINAALRHIAEYQDRLDVEPESGQSPLAHAIASLNILLDAKKAGTLIDDRPPLPLALDSQCPD